MDRRLTLLLAGAASLLATGAFASDLNTVSLEMAALTNQGPPGPVSSSEYYAGAGLSVSHTFWSRLQVDGQSLADSVGAELSIFYYQVFNYQTEGDQYSVVPVSLTARYSVRALKYLEPYVYAGVLKNFSQGPLDNTRPAIGCGAFVRFGDVFSVRADAGTDQLGLGLSLFL